MFPPLGLTKSGVACWWSLKNLIDSGPCYLWTFTTADTHPDYVYGFMHRELLKYLNNDTMAGRFPVINGVRVIEEHPGGHGLHFHWVVRGKLPVHRVRYRAERAGFGRINVDPEPCTPLVAPYLCKYLLKNSKLHGVRMWANIGAWEGVKTRDIEVDSNSSRVFRDNFRHARAMGKTRGAAFNFAKVEQFAYDNDFTEQSTGTNNPF